MAELEVVTEGVNFDSPAMVEGFPGVGLVGKIAADHLIEEFDMTHYGNIYCNELPSVGVYEEGDRSVKPPVRLYVNDDGRLVVLRSDVPVSPEAATSLADEMTPWFDRNDVTPIYLSGIPNEKDEGVPKMYGVGTGRGGEILDEAGVDPPDESGVVSGPTGALLDHATLSGATTLGLIVESDPRFPDPEASQVLIQGIERVAGIDVPTDDLVDRAEEIREAKDHLAQRMQEADEESSQAQPMRMFQ